MYYKSLSITFEIPFGFNIPSKISFSAHILFIKINLTFLGNFLENKEEAY